MRRLLCVVVIALIVGACSSDKTPAGLAGRGTLAPATTTTSGLPADIVLSVKTFPVHSAAAPAAGEAEAAQAGVLATLQSYLVAGSLTPLKTGAPAGDISPLFTERTAPRATVAPDRAALYDEGLPVIDGLRAEKADLDLTGLVGKDGRMVVVAAHYSVKLKGAPTADSFTVQREADFVMVPDRGAWRIDAYEVQATRDSVAGTTTTTAASR